MHKSCGTYSGYTIHIRDKTEICSECRDASRLYQKSRRTKTVSNLGYDPRRFSRHNITKEHYEDLMSRHDNKCWICKESEATAIDHDHSCCAGARSSCGKCIRGVLCSNCNTAIGLLKDKKENVLSALNYLSQ